MNVLLVGSGGREHALAWKLAQSPLLTSLLIAPGNPGMAALGKRVPVASDSIPLLIDIARHEQVDLVVVGPEAPLALGLADACRAAGIAVFGPTQAAAQIETSKAFAKDVMQAAGVATAQSHQFQDVSAALAFAESSGEPWVVKADGLASGKGVVVADTLAQTLDAIRQIGATGAGSTLLLEERMHGPEVSIIALCDGERLLALPPARDHKRLGAGDTGPNTGGMGTIAPVALDNATYQQIVDSLMLPTIRELAARGTPFVGALFAGIMLTETGPRVLEFNARFGDPETQVLMPLLDGDLLAAMLACAEGRLDTAMLRWNGNAAACVVMASAGYPAAPRTGDVIRGLESVEPADALVFHAGTDWRDGTTVTAGGRVLGITGVGATRDAALVQAYATRDLISFPGAQWRPDIGKTAE